MNVLIDAGPIIALFDARDDRHDEVIDFFKQFTGRLVTTCPVVTECMWNMKSDERVQKKFLNDLAEGNTYNIEPLISKDYRRIAELNNKYVDLPADFADLSLIAISERLIIQKLSLLMKTLTYTGALKRSILNASVSVLSYDNNFRQHYLKKLR